MRVATYLRVSTEEQALHGYSLPDQREACRERARLLGAEEIFEFVDEGHTGAVLERPGLTALREAVWQGNINYIVIRDPDRLSRRLAHQLLLTEEFEKAGAKLEFIDFEWQDTPEGRLFYSIRGAVAEYEREKIRDRTIRGKLQKAKQGKIPHRFYVYGYNYDPATGKVTINEDEASVVRQMFAWFTEDDIGANGIANKLNNAGIPSKRGKKWHRKVIVVILSNPTYTGTWFFNRRNCRAGRKGQDYSLKPEKEWIPVTVPAIIDHKVFERAQAKMLATRRLYAGYSRHLYLLSGLVTCITCRYPMHGERTNVWGTRVRIYTCEVRTAGNLRGCGCRVRADKLEAQVWNIVKSYLNDPDAIVREIKTAQDNGAIEKEIDQIDKALARIEKGRSSLVDALASGVLDLDMDIKARLADLKKQREKLLERRKELEKALTEVTINKEKIKELRQIAEIILGRTELLSEDEKREIVRAIIKQIVVQKKEKNIYFTLYLNIPETVAVTVNSCKGFVT